MAIVIPGTEGYTNGAYEIPSPKEAGNDVFDILEEFMQRIANHSHTGADSKNISLNIEKSVDEFDFTSLSAPYTWNEFDPVNQPSTYRALLPINSKATGVDENVRFYYYREFRASSEPKRFYPTIEKYDNSNYYIYVNDNTIDIRVVTI